MDALDLYRQRIDAIHNPATKPPTYNQKSPLPKCTLHVEYCYNKFAWPCEVIAKMVGRPLEILVVDEDTRKSKDYQAKNILGKFPMLETEEGRLNESIAISKYLAYGDSKLLGSNYVEHAQID